MASATQGIVTGVIMSMCGFAPGNKHFAKVSLLLNLLYERTIKLIFEKFYQPWRRKRFSVKLAFVS